VPVIEQKESTLYFEVYGSGPPLLFLHGVGGSLLVWWQQVHFFSRSYQCILVDQRGWGRSSGPLPEPWVEAFVPDLEAVLDELDVREFAVIAQSMGGWTVNAFCQAHQERIRAAVMAGSTGGFVPPKVRPLYQDALERKRELQLLWQMGRGPHPALGPRIYNEQPALAQLYTMLGRLNRPLNKNRSAGLPLTERNDLRLIGNTAFIYGDEDAVCPRQVIEATASETPGSVTYCIPHSGHSTYFERADRFNRTALDFLKSYYG
jgi:3-oxoadipate enol-lactonase